MTEVLIVFVTVGNAEEAVALARQLVQERLVACVNLIPHIRSLYWWKGEVHDEPELLLIMKTSASRLPELEARIEALHSYEVPEIVAFPITRGLPAYLDWVVQNTRQAASGE